MPEPVVIETPQPVPAVVVEAAANNAAETPVQSSFNPNAAADALAAEYSAKIAELASPPEPKLESEPAVVEAKTEENEAEVEQEAAPVTDAATETDPFAEFEPKQLLRTDDEIDTEFNRVPKDARAALKEVTAYARELEEQVNAAPELPDYVTPIAAALDFVVPEGMMDAQKLAQVNEHADNLLDTTFERNGSLGKVLARKFVQFAYENYPEDTLNIGLKALDTDIEHIKTLLGYEKAGIFDPKDAADAYDEYLRSAQPLVMEKLDRVETDNQQLRRQITQLQTGSQRENEEKLNQTVKDHETSLRTQVMEAKVKPILNKVGWDKVPGLGEVLNDWAGLQFDKSPELKDLNELVRAGKLTSREYGRKKQALEHAIAARVASQASKIYSGLPGTKKTAIPTPAAKETAVETPTPPLAKLKTTYQRGDILDVDAVERQLRAAANAMARG